MIWCDVKYCDEPFVMAELVPAIHVLLGWKKKKDVDARHKAGHDGEMLCN